MTLTINGPRPGSTCHSLFVKNIGADQPAVLQRSLISSFIIRFLESIVARLAMNKNAIF